MAPQSGKSCSVFCLRVVCDMRLALVPPGGHQDTIGKPPGHHWETTWTPLGHHRDLVGPGERIRICFGGCPPNQINVTPPEHDRN